MLMGRAAEHVEARRICRVKAFEYDFLGILADVKAVGFVEFKIDGYSAPEFVAHAGSSNFGRRYSARRAIYNLEGPFSKRVRQVIDAGLIDGNTVTEAIEQWDAWYEHPYAFYAQVNFLVGGRV